MPPTKIPGKRRGRLRPCRRWTGRRRRSGRPFRYLPLRPDRPRRRRPRNQRQAGRLRGGSTRPTPGDAAGDGLERFVHIPQDVRRQPKSHAPTISRNSAALPGAFWRRRQPSRRLFSAGRASLPAEMRTPGALLLFWFGLSIAAGACRHDCAASGAPRAHFMVASCCSGQPQYYWDGRAQDCVALSAIGSQNCGCVCDGKDCDRLFWSRDACRKEYSHCR